MSKIEGPVTITIADIYLRFPEIMEEEYKDLLKFLKDNFIAYKHATGSFKKQQMQIQNVIDKCHYLLENKTVEIDGNTYYKHECDDIITRYILEGLEEGDSNGN